MRKLLAQSNIALEMQKPKEPAMMTLGTLRKTKAKSRVLSQILQPGPISSQNHPWFYHLLLTVTSTKCTSRLKIEGYGNNSPWPFQAQIIHIMSTNPLHCFLLEAQFHLFCLYSNHGLTASSSATIFGFQNFGILQHHHNNCPHKHGPQQHQGHQLQSTPLLYGLAFVQTKKQSTMRQRGSTCLVSQTVGFAPSQEWGRYGTMHKQNPIPTISY